jgi:hypothetical protein
MENPNLVSCPAGVQFSSLNFDESNQGHCSSTIPSLMLTFPTPLLDNSPVFAPSAPLTVPKFVTVSDSGKLTPLSMHSSHQLSGTSAPALPACTRCDLSNDLPCRDCEQQWLACKLWYHTKEGGLKEPLVRPAESNRDSREMMRILGLAVGSSKGLGIDVRDKLVGTGGNGLSTKELKRSQATLASQTPKDGASLGNQINGFSDGKGRGGMKPEFKLAALWNKVAVLFRRPFHRKRLSGGTLSDTAQTPRQTRKLRLPFPFRRSQSDTTSLLGACGILPLAANISPLYISRTTFRQDDMTSERCAFVDDARGPLSTV